MKYLVILLLALAFNAQGFELYLVRHFEKQVNQTDPDLTDRGAKRAQSLANLLANKELAAIYSTQYNRTLQSAKPISDKISLLTTSYNPRELSEFAQRLLHAKQNALVVGHSNTTPELIKLLGGEAKVIHESDYGELFLLIVLPNSVITQSVFVGHR